MDVAVSTIPVAMAGVRELAVAAERHGIRRLGVADSPRLFGAAYPAVQEALGATERLRVGPFVTNPVTRHASVHGATLRALAELAPGRVGLAMGAGDSAVTSVGLAPASREQLAEALRQVREAAGPEAVLEMAVSGPRAADAVPAEVDGVVLGSGLSAEWARTLHERAERAAGRRLTARVVVVACLVDDEAELEQATRAVRSSVLAYGRHGIGGDLAARGVPEPIRAGLAEVFAGYRMDEHARITGANTALLEDRPGEAAYLASRYALVGTPEQAAERLARFSRESGVDGVSISVNVPDPLAQLAAIGDRLLPALARLGHPQPPHGTEKR